MVDEGSILAQPEEKERRRRRSRYGRKNERKCRTQTQYHEAVNEENACNDSSKTTKSLEQVTGQ